ETGAVWVGAFWLGEEATTVDLTGLDGVPAGAATDLWASADADLAALEIPRHGVRLLRLEPSAHPCPTRGRRRRPPPYRPPQQGDPSHACQCISHPRPRVRRRAGPAPDLRLVRRAPGPLRLHRHPRPGPP